MTVDGYYTSVTAIHQDMEYHGNTYLIAFQNALIANTGVDAAQRFSIFADSRLPGGHRESTREWSGIGR